MFVRYNLLVFFVYLLLPEVRPIQLRLVNSNNNGKDNSYASTYDNYKPDSYNYNYGVSDQNTGDHKTKWEKRENGVVRGAYSILEPDGSTRVVEYTADQTGFHPVVRRLDTASVTPSTNLQPAYSLSTPAPPYNVYQQPVSLLYSNQYNRRRFGASNYDYNNVRQLSPSNAYAMSILNSGYNNGYYNRVRFPGYDDVYRGYDDLIASGAPYHLPLRQEKQPIPLLHSAYHGYDNLYH